jgi:hypothetical protein
MVIVDNSLSCFHVLFLLAFPFISRIILSLSIEQAPFNVETALHKGEIKEFTVAWSKEFLHIHLMMTMINLLLPKNSS